MPDGNYLTLVQVLSNMITTDSNVRVVALVRTGSWILHGVIRLFAGLASIGIALQESGRRFNHIKHALLVNCFIHS